jgi:hypothetical protein
MGKYIGERISEPDANDPPRGGPGRVESDGLRQGRACLLKSAPVY